MGLLLGDTIGGKVATQTRNMRKGRPRRTYGVFLPELFPDPVPGPEPPPACSMLDRMSCSYAVMAQSRELSSPLSLHLVWGKAKWCH